MSEWIELEPSSLGRNEHDQIDGVEIIVGLSPYDVPEAVRGGYDKDIGRFVIEFRYLDDGEERVSDAQEEDVVLLVGEHSKRLYAIHVDVDRLKAEKVGLKVLIPEVDEAIDKLGRKPQYSGRLSHYEVAKDVISQNSEKLLAGV